LRVNHYHWPFDDPAEFTGTEEEVRAEFQRVRDEIKRVMTGMAPTLGGDEVSSFPFCFEF